MGSNDPVDNDPAQGRLATTLIAATSAFDRAHDGEPAADSEVPLGSVIGRYVVLARLGRGGMGVVYAAFDPGLDRKVALKLLLAGTHAQTQERARLLREAQAMAKLSHPAVVSVFDVGTFGDQVWVAMEFVDGRTLTAWLRERHDWREILAVFMRAGEGLRAAHAAGLVHRDFKPDNTMISADGRVRVMDFGLVLAEVAAPPEIDADAPTLQRQPLLGTSLTRAGTLMGTPRYMAPEQWARAQVDARTDQFAFCVSLWEALYGAPPFGGETLAEIAIAVTRGKPSAPARTRVPAWLRRVLLRGLAADPAERWPAMDDLLRALERGRARARGGVVVAAALAIGMGVGGSWAARNSGVVVDPCSGGASEIAEVWGPAAQGRVEQALAAAGPAFAAELWPRVSGELEHYSSAWRASHREACEAHQRGESSDSLLDRRMACLSQRKHALGEAVVVLAEGEVDVALRALEVIHGLPALGPCSDLAALAADAPPASDPRVRAAVEALRPRLDRVQALEHAGVSASAASLADEVIHDAERVGDPRLLTEALLQRGRLQINQLDRPRSNEALLTRAYLVALGSRLDELATEALALRMYFRSRDHGQTDRALEDLAVAREMIKRIPSPGRVHGLLLNNAGTVYLTSGDIARATALFREALAVREAALGPEHLDVAFTLANLALVSPEAERLPLFQRVLEIFDRQLGQAHPQNLEMRLAASMFAVDPREARALIEPGCQALGRFAGDPVQRARCLHYLGHYASEASDDEAAAAAFTAAARLLPADAAASAMTPLEAAQLRGRAALYTGDHAGAITSLREVLAAQAPASEPWRRGYVAELALLLGLHLTHVGDREGARKALTSAIAGFEAATERPGNVVLHQRLAYARVALAELLLAPAALAAERDQASTLLVRAEQWYRGAGAGYVWRFEGLAALRRKAGLP